MTVTMADMIQPGWTVVDADGETIGTVKVVEGREIIVRKAGLLGGEMRVSKDACHLVEEGRVELSQKKSELVSA